MEGGDVYILQHIIHNGDEENAMKILRACRGAMGGSSRLVLSERLIAPRAAFQRVKRPTS